MFSMAMVGSHKVDVGGLLAGSGQRILIDDNVALEPFEGLDFPRPVAVHLEVRCIDRWLEISGTVEATVRGACDACLEEVAREMRVDVDERLDPSAPLEEDPFGEANVLSGSRLDVADLAQQVLLSALPLGFRCKDDCAGLCATCGTNFNTGVCSCTNGDQRG